MNCSSAFPYNSSSVIALQHANKSINHLLIIVESRALQEMHARVQNKRAVLVHVRARDNVLQLVKDPGNIDWFPSEHQVHLFFSGLC